VTISVGGQPPLPVSLGRAPEEALPPSLSIALALSLTLSLSRSLSLSLSLSRSRSLSLSLSLVAYSQRCWRDSAGWGQEQTEANLIEMTRCSNLHQESSLRVFKAHRLVYHLTLGWRVIKKKKISQRDLSQEMAQATISIRFTTGSTGVPRS